MFRPWLRVAQPDDWTGSLVQVGSLPVYFVVLLSIVIGRISEAWWVLGSELLTRLLLALVAIYLLGWVRAIAFTLLPKTVVQFGSRLWFRHHGRRVVVRIAAIVAIDVELRPNGELFVIEVDNQNGTTSNIEVYDLCPVAWEGAPRIFSVLARRVRWAKIRASRRRVRAARRASEPDAVSP